MRKIKAAKAEMAKVYAVRDAVRKQLDEEGDQGLQNFVFIQNNGEIKKYLHEACYASLYYYKEWNKRSKYLIDFVNHDRYKGYQDILLGFEHWYIDWILNRSPWSSVFRTRSAKVAIDKGIICRVDKPSNLIIGGLMAIRYIYENPKIVRLFGELVAGGVDENVAMIVAQYSTCNTGKKTFSMSGYGLGGHSSFEHSFSYTTMYNFINSKPEGAGGYKGGTGYSDATINDLWGLNRKYNDPPKIARGNPSLVKTPWGKEKIDSWEFSQIKKFNKTVIPLLYKDMEKYK